MQILGQSGANVSGLSGDRVESSSLFLFHIRGFQLRVVALWSFAPLISHLASEAGEGELDSSRGSSPEDVALTWSG